MTGSFTPHGYQQEIINFIQNTKRCAVFSAMGSGKTVSTLTAIEQMSLIDLDYPVLILAPLRVARSTWPNEVHKWAHTSDLSVKAITGSVIERKAALITNSDIYTCNYENLPWLVKELDDKWPFKTVIIDESTHLKGFRLRQGAKRPKELAKVAHTLINRIVLLTGTPAPNGLIDLWGQMWFIDKGAALGKTFSAFKDRWFTADESGFGIKPLPHAQQEIQDAIKHMCITIDMEKWFKIEKPIEHHIKLDLPLKVHKQYKAMEKTMFMEIENGAIEALSRGVATIKCSQVCSGAVYFEDKTFEVLHDEKIEALRSIVEEANGMPILVAYRFVSDLKRLMKAFPEGRVLDKDPKTERDWCTGKIPILFAHPKSAGHGLNLQDGGNILVFFSVNWPLEAHMQIIERIGPMRQMQSGHKRPVFVYYLLMRDTIDETIMERLVTKQTVQDILLNAMKRYKETS